ncbi:MAG: CBS domain-containing protein [Burkholderiales bacterium]|nr:CBS domain-containing protein [Burkholderiales bacterium]
MSTPISSMMTAQTKTARMDATIAQVEALLRSNQISAVPIIEAEGEFAIGIISMRDILRFHHDKKDPYAVHAWEVCSYKPIIVAPDTASNEVARLMIHHDIHHILVMQDAHIVGIVSALDFVAQAVHDPN